ncbi:hypothetical protein PhCBS80983_g04593 [Powellomyces hirtus]|uniref:Uncharacterized protein n=1 Tax=Powellomyces hirtus TaxID=109895 RepID=A0A507DYY2_9FUNG|nr:hypothetical protein PhCBS80983_g04593 [Powellomyces hirtus]
MHFASVLRNEWRASASAGGDGHFNNNPYPWTTAGSTASGGPAHNPTSTSISTPFDNDYYDDLPPPLPPACPGHHIASYEEEENDTAQHKQLESAETSYQSTSREMSAATSNSDLESVAEEPEPAVESSDRFFRSLLQTCSQGFHSIEPAERTPEIRRGLMACQLGLDYLDALANHDDEAAEQVRKMEAATTQQERRLANHRQLENKRTGRYIPRLPAEILLRVFNFACYNEGFGTYPPSRSVQKTLFSCSLVAKDWNRPANAVLWKRVNMSDHPGRFGRFVLGSATSKYNKRESSALVRVLSVACTDADLSLLSVACHHTTELHSLELQRTRDMDACSYRLLQRLPNRFPSLRSLVADNILPIAWPDLVKLCATCPLLSNLHISFPTMTTDSPVEFEPPTAADFETLFAGIPFLQSLSLWRVPIPADKEDAIVNSLAKHCKNLRAVRIDDCGRELTMSLFQSMWNQCRQLQCITLRMIRHPPCFAPVHLEALPTLRTLLVDGCWLSDDLLGYIGRSAPNLETLYIENDWRDSYGAIGSVVHITDHGIMMIAPHLRNLRTISLVGLMGNPHLSARSVRSLLSYNRNVSALNLARPNHAESTLTDESLLYLAPCLTRLRRLELYMQCQISEDALAQALADACRLISLGLSGCHQLTDATVGVLTQLCPFLERLDMAGVSCSDAGLQRLIDAGKHLRECVVDCGQGENVRWGDVINFDDPWSEEVFSPYSVWEKEVRRVAGLAGFVY